MYAWAGERDGKFISTRTRRLKKMKPTQKSILILLGMGSYTRSELYEHFHKGKTGVTVNWVGKQNWSKLQTWVNRHVKPLVRDGYVCCDAGPYKLTEKGERIVDNLV